MRPKFLLLASFADSILQFRGALIESLQAQGLDVHVAAPNLTAQHAVGQQLLQKGCYLHPIALSRTGTNPLADARLLLQLTILMRQLRPQALMAYTVKPVIYGLIAARWAKVPRRFALITGLGYAFQDQSGRGVMQKLVQALYRMALLGAHKVFFQNPDDARLFVQRRLIGPHTPHVVVNGSGVDLAHYPWLPVPQGSAHFLLIARLLGDKGVREYVGAASRLKQRDAALKFSVVGWIDDNPDAIDEAELKTWIDKGWIDFLGRQQDVRPALAACTTYVLPSYREGTPRTVLEAMAMGRAIITTDAPGCRETVQQGRNGWLVPVKSVEELAQAMEKMVQDPSLAVSMGTQSRQIVEEKYDVHKVNQHMLKEMGLIT